MISLGLVSSAIARELVHVEPRVLLAHPVGDDVEVEAGEVDLHPVGEMAAVVELHAEDAVARIEQRHVHGGVGLRAGVRLHVGVLGPEQLLGAVDGQLLGHVDVLTAAVVALAGVALGVLVGQHRPLAIENRLRHEVLRGDHLERASPGGAASSLSTWAISGSTSATGFVKKSGAQLGHPGHRTSGSRLRYPPRSAAATSPRPERRPRGRPRSRRRPRRPAVDHRRRRARQLAAVEDHVHAGPDARVHVAEPAHVGAAGAVGARLEHGPARARERRERALRAAAPAARAARARGRRPAGSAGPGWAARA